MALEQIRAILKEDQAKEMDEIMVKCSGAELTFADACSDALVGMLSGEERLELGERSKRFDLAMLVVKGGEVEITTEQRDMIKQCITKYFGGATIPSRVAEMLEEPPKAGT